jgi:hypothetical protein
MVFLGHFTALHNQIPVLEGESHGQQQTLIFFLAHAFNDHIFLCSDSLTLAAVNSTCKFLIVTLNFKNRGKIYFRLNFFMIFSRIASFG